MKIGDKTFYIEDDVERECEIYRIYLDEFDNIYYDVLFNERNVPFESLYVQYGSKPKKSDEVFYKKGLNLYEAYVAKIDWNSKSAQIKIIKRHCTVNPQ